ncbi:envelope glycoprotein L [Elephant endotheliotropic herpesvirus 3A]|uniref:Envelope glycoprotein L n=1 Tax=Elephant endotheliotropic herpesvirus 3A TaxID=1329409 RepID=A0A866VSW2_9BETA|nr:envelope glycoprotein L [Elephant endotheliotropic herpesvirus 3A]QOE74469.1 envelope glycoprotein L [Elephant endotheliotropic herpesvirus 3A]
MSSHGGYATTILFLPVVLSLFSFHNKTNAFSYDLSPSCITELHMCLTGQPYAFSSHVYTDAYSKMIGYTYDSKAPRVTAPLVNASQDIMSLMYNNTEELRVFLTLRRGDSGLAAGKNMRGLHSVYAPDYDDPKRVACDGKYADFACSPGNRHRCGTDLTVNMLHLNYQHSIFTENVLSVMAYKKPFRVVVRVLVTNDATNVQKAVSIPFDTPALLDVLFSCVYRRVYRHREGLRLLHTFKRFYLQSVDERFRGPRSRTLNRILAIYDDSTMDRELL